MDILFDKVMPWAYVVFAVVAVGVSAMRPSPGRPSLIAGFVMSLLTSLAWRVIDLGLAAGKFDWEKLTPVRYGIKLIGVLSSILLVAGVWMAGAVGGLPFPPRGGNGGRPDSERRQALWYLNPTRRSLLPGMRRAKVSR